MATRTNKKKSPSVAQREGKLGGPGYTRKSVAARRKILRAVVKKYGYRSALSSVMGMERSATISATARRVLASDRVFLRETFGAAATKKRASAARSAARRNPFVVDDVIIARVVAALVTYLGNRTIRGLAIFNALPRDERRPKLIAALKSKKALLMGGPLVGPGVYLAAKQIAENPRLVEHLLDLIEEYGPAAAEHANEFATTKLTRKNSLRIRTGRTATVTTYLNPEREECPTHSVPLLNGRCIPCEYEDDVGMKTNRRRK